MGFTDSIYYGIRLEKSDRKSEIFPVGTSDFATIGLIDKK